MKKISIAIVILLFFAACNNDKDNKTPDSADTTGTSKEPAPERGKRSITERKFGEYEGQPVTEYTLTNSGGAQVGIINYGGAITKIIVPDIKGEMGDVVTGFESMNGFAQKNNPYFGALIGRYGNRIGGAKFKLDGKEYTLAGNDNGNNLHGGNKGFDKRLWSVEKKGDSSLVLKLTSKDGEEGFPGEVAVTVQYSWSEENELTINYSATTTKATPINLTSHAYFNLSAGKSPNILGHHLVIAADKYTPVNDQLIPTGKIENVKGGPMDFTAGKYIGEDIGKVKGGFDHNWVLRRNGNGLFKAAYLFDSITHRDMIVYTTEPGLQFYSGNFLDGSLTDTKGGVKYGNHAALCLETQHYPDSPNQPSFPSTIVKPGEKYETTTIYQFSAR